MRFGGLPEYAGQRLRILPAGAQGFAAWRVQPST
jgi:hypothetical protein